RILSIIQTIFMYLPPKDNLLIIPKSTSTILRLKSSPPLWTTLYLERIEDFLFLAHSCRYCSCHHGLKNVMINVGLSCFPTVDSSMSNSVSNQMDHVE